MQIKNKIKLFQCTITEELVGKNLEEVSLILHKLQIKVTQAASQK